MTIEFANILPEAIRLRSLSGAGEKLGSLPLRVLKTALLGGCILTAGLAGASAEMRPEPRFERISLDEGLSQSTVFCILRDSRGFLWFGTEDGLNLWDGYTFTVFRNIPFDSRSLAINTVLSLHEDREGAIWAGTASGGLNRLDRNSGRFARYPLDPEHPGNPESYSVTAIVPGPENTLWVGTDYGLCRFDPRSGRFTRHAHDTDNSRSIASDLVLALQPDPSGLLWVGTSRGLDRFDPRSGEFFHFPLNFPRPDAPGGNLVRSLCLDRKGILWAATSAGIARMDTRTGRFEPFEPGGSLAGVNVRAIMEDRSGVLWIGAWGEGLFRVDPRTGKADRFRHDSQNPRSLSSDVVISLHEDGFGNIFAGTVYGGLNKIRHSGGRFSHLGSEPGNPDHRVSSHVWSIIEDREGMLWAGTLFGGAIRIDRKSGRYTEYREKTASADGLSGSTIMSILEDSRGDLWFGTDGYGLDRLDRKTGRFRHFRHDPADPAGLSGNYVWSILEDSRGDLWFGTSGGLDRYDRERGEFAHFRSLPADTLTLSSEDVTCIYETRAGEFWVGTAGGLNRLNRDTGVCRRYRNDPDNLRSLSYNRIWCIHEDRAGRLWIGTWGGGLNRYDPKTDSFVHYTERNGLSNNTVYAILEDDAGKLWMSTNRGLSCFDPGTETFRNYTAEDGLLNTEFNARAACRDRNGEMFFGGTNGITRFFPEAVTVNPRTPPVAVTAVRVMHHPAFPGVVLPEGGTIRLRHDETSLSFEFAALDFTSPGQNRYAYRLEGFDRDWVQSGSSRVATYTRLKPGEYTFRVRGTNSDGVWNEEGATVRILVSPPLWGTWWFRGIGLAMLAGTVLSVHFTRVRALSRRKRELELLVREKTDRLERSRNELLQLVETSPDAILMTDPEDRIIASNSRAAGLFGVDAKAELIGLRLDEFLARPGREPGDAKSAPEPDQVEVVVLPRNGVSVPAEINSAAVTEPNGAPRSRIHIIRDIRERKRTEEERVERERLRGIVELAGAACHELSQPLQAMFGYSDLILSGPGEPEQDRSFIKGIRREAERMRSITTKLQNITFYRTKSYNGSERIIDLDRASALPPEDPQKS